MSQANQYAAANVLLLALDGKDDLVHAQIAVWGDGELAALDSVLKTLHLAIQSEFAVRMPEGARTPVPGS